MSTLVTGGAGFIGSHLCEQLIKKNKTVICLDNFYTGSKQNIIECRKDFKFELIRHDVTDPIRIEVDKIWHLACPGSPAFYQEDPIKTTKTIFSGTVNVLELSKRYRAKLLIASSSEIYGNPKEHPQKEGYFGNVNPIGKRSCYEEGKRIAESLCVDYSNKYNLDIKI